MTFDRVVSAILFNGRCFGVHVGSGSVLPRGLDPLSDEFASNKDTMRDLMQRLQSITDGVFKAGGDTAVARHHSRGKLLPRERINRIIDEGSPFLELSPLAGYGLYGTFEGSACGWESTVCRSCSVRQSNRILLVFDRLTG